MSDIGFTFDLAPIARWVLAVAMVFAGVMHFVKPRFYLRMMPPYVPMHRAAVLWSGVAELALGVALVVDVTRPWSAYALIALFVAVFPANVHMAVEGIGLAAADPPPSWMLWARLPLQPVFIAWALWSTRALELVRGGRARVARADDVGSPSDGDDSM